MFKNKVKSSDSFTINYDKPYIIISYEIDKDRQKNLINKCKERFSIKEATIVSPDDNLFFYEPEVAFIDAKNEDEIDCIIERLKEESLYDKCSLLLVCSNRELEEYLYSKEMETHKDKEISLFMNDLEHIDCRMSLNFDEKRRLVSALSC